MLREHGGALRRVASSYEADPGHAEDLFQEICLAIWRALPRFRGESSLRTFVFRVAHNRGLSHGWREARRPRESEEPRGLTDERPGPDARYERREETARLYAAIRRLPPLTRQVLTLRLEGLAFAEIGEIMGQSENNVTVRASRARKALRELLEESPGTAGHAARATRRDLARGAGR